MINGMPVDDENLKRLACLLGGGALGALLLKTHHDEARKSRAEKDDPHGVEWLCNLIGELLDNWEPRDYSTEDGYTEALYRYLNRELPDALDEDDPDVTVEMRTSTLFGIPDILINDLLVLELKLNPEKGERDRLIGQCCGYSCEWVTWAIVIGMPQHRVRELETLLEAKSLHYIEVIPFS
jgi:hypothetical protein